jgi:hypothetical protein
MLAGTVHEYSVLRTQAGTERRGSRLSGQMRTGGVARLSQRLISHDELHADGRSEGPGRAGKLAASPIPSHRGDMRVPPRTCLPPGAPGFQTPRSLAGEPQRNIVPWPRFLITRSLQSFPQLLRPRTHSAPQVHPIWGVLPPTQHFPCRDLARLGHEGDPRKEDRTGFAWVCWSGHGKRAAWANESSASAATHNQQLPCRSKRTDMDILHAFLKVARLLEPPRRRPPQCRVPRTAVWATRHPLWNLCPP